ncbi:MAG: LysR family transcriptional regulator [Chloroflexota bacterium]
MEIHQLQYFVAVAETGGFSRAAKRCNVAQPSLSQQIIKLEQELGEKLFDRLGRSIALTEAGKVLLPKAKLILTEVQDIRRNVVNEIETGKGHLSVGFIPTIAPFVLPVVLKSFKGHYPSATLSVTEDLTDGLIEKLVDAEIDVGIMSLPIKHKLIATETLATEPLLVIASDEIGLQTSKPTSTVDLEGVPFIALNEVHCLGEQIQAYCYEHKVSPDIVCQTAQLTTVKGCVESGLGISLIPKMCAVSEAKGKYNYFSIVDNPPTRTIVAAWHSGRIKSFLAKAFVEDVRIVCTEILAQTVR